MGPALVHPRTVADVFAAFGRANLEVDSLLEPVARPADPPSPFWSESMTLVPATLVVRGRKLGI